MKKVTQFPRIIAILMMVILINAGASSLQAQKKLSWNDFHFSGFVYDKNFVAIAKNVVINYYSSGEISLSSVVNSLPREAVGLDVTITLKNKSGSEIITISQYFDIQKNGYVNASGKFTTVATQYEKIASANISYTLIEDGDFIDGYEPSNDFEMD